MVSHKETFGKSEKLCSKKAIAELFEHGNSFFCFPFQIIWTFGPGIPDSPAQIGLSVSKRNFRKAVTRNLIKRRIREAYRKKKHRLYDFLIERNIKVLFFVIYKDNIAGEYRLIEKAMDIMIEKFITILKEQDIKC